MALMLNFSAPIVAVPSVCSVEVVPVNTKIVSIQGPHSFVYRYDPYGPTPTAEKEVCLRLPEAVPEAPLCGQDMNVMPSSFWSSPYEYAEQVPCQYSHPATSAWLSPSVMHPAPVESISQQAFPQGWCVPEVQQMMQHPMQMMPIMSSARESTTPAGPPSMFDGCRTKRERRALAILVITKGLQQGKNRTYGASRRKMTKWAQLQGISKEDLQVMVEYLNELCLAGAAYDLVAAGVSAARLAEDVSMTAVSHVAHLLSTDEMWEGCLCYNTPADFHARQ